MWGYAGSPVNLPYPWIGFQLWHEEERGEDSPASRSMHNPEVSPTGLFSWFSQFQLVIMNRSSYLRAEEDYRTNLSAPQQVPNHLRLPPLWDTRLSVFFHDSSFIFLAALDGAHTPWILPSLRTSSVYERNEPAPRALRVFLHLVLTQAETLSCSQERVMTPILLSLEWFLTQKLRCIY